MQTKLLDQDNNRSRDTLLLLGIIFVAFNLRPSITSVGPLISEIRIDTGISNSLAGMLTTLPLMAFAFLSLLAPKIAKRIGVEWTVFLSLIVLAVGILLRSEGMIVSLYVGTAFMGLGIAILNVLLPGIVKQNFPTKIGMMTGIYTVSMAVWAGIAPGVSVPLAEEVGWKHSLGVWIFLVIAGLALWIPQLIKKRAVVYQAKVKQTTESFWKSPLAWQVTLFMGLQSLVYFSFVAWLPEMLYSNGINPTTAGWMVTLLQFSGLPVNFLIPYLADRLPHQKGLSLGIGIFCLVGIFGILIGGSTLVLTISIIFIGISTGAAISLALTLMGLRVSNSDEASKLSAMSQSVGYLLAATGPITLGFLFDLFHTWTLPLVILLLLTVVMTIAGIGAGRNKLVFQESGSTKTI